MLITYNEIFILGSCILAILLFLMFFWVIRGKDDIFLQKLDDIVEQKKTERQIKTHKNNVVSGNMVFAAIVFSAAFLFSYIPLANALAISTALSTSSLYILLDETIGDRIKRLISKKFDIKYIVPIRFGLFDQENSYDAHITEGYLESIYVAKLIRGVTGEMGHRLFDNQKLIDAFEYALKKNGAQISFIHGPNVDPKSTKIFELTKHKSFKLIRNEQYHHNHFTLIETNDDKKIIIDEGLHEEVFWSFKTKEAFHENRTRAIFIYSGDKRLKTWERKSKTLLNRSSSPNSKIIKSHPGLNSPQNISLFKFLKELLWYNMILGNIVQPIAIWLDMPINLLYE